MKDLCEEDEPHVLLLYSKVRPLSRGEILTMVFERRNYLIELFFY